MSLKQQLFSPVSEDWEEPVRKKIKIDSAKEEAFQNTRGHLISPHINGGQHEDYAQYDPDGAKDKSITIASTAKHAPQAVAHFLAKHIPVQYAPLGKGGRDVTPTEKARDSNSKYCYRHRPDMLCRRQADEPSMEKLQKGLEALSQEDRQGIVQVWSLFSAAPSKHRNLMLQGVLAQCCFPQLSYLSANVRELIRIDFLSALPSEVAFRILCFLDTASLCKAAQVSRKWRQLADDDVVWHRMCEQHIDRKCNKCGWGLPLLERKKLRASKRQIQLRATGRGVNEWSPAVTPLAENANDSFDQSDTETHHDISDVEKSDGKLSPVALRRTPLGDSDNDHNKKTRPWKDIYKARFRIGTNWKYGRCSIKVLKGHSNGVMALQLYENILATGSYDATIKLWDLDTDEEIRTLKGHTMGIRCLQFDDTKLISGSLDKTLKVWNWRSGECISTYHGHTDGIISLHFDSNILVSGSIDKTARIWNFQDKSVFTLRGHSDWINSVKIDSASRTIFTASDDCTIKLWDLDTKKCIRVFEGHVGQVQQVLPLPSEFNAEEEESEEAEAEYPPDIISDLGSPHSISALTDSSSHNDRDTCATTTTIYSSSQTHSTNPDIFISQPNRPKPPRYMLTSALDSTIRLWEVSTGRCIRTYFGHVEGVWAIAADTLRIVSGAEDRMVKVWDPRSDKAEKTFTGHAGPVTCIGLSDSRMCSGSEDGEIRVYNFIN